MKFRALLACLVLVVFLTPVASASIVSLSGGRPRDISEVSSRSFTEVEGPAWSEHDWATHLTWLYDTTPAWTIAVTPCALGNADLGPGFAIMAGDKPGSKYADLEVVGLTAADGTQLSLVGVGGGPVTKSDVVLDGKAVFWGSKFSPGMYPWPSPTTYLPAR